MAGLLSGLSKLGLENLDGMELYGTPEEKEEPKESKEKDVPEVKEEDFLFDKTYECPVCYQTFKSKTVRSSKARLIRTDKDLRPVYQDIDPLKYDVAVCNCCGYAVLSKNFGGLTPTQIKSVRENISVNFKSFDRNESVYSYEEALDRHKLCLANTIVKRGKASEKAYVCLKTGWLVRSMKEKLDPEKEGYEKKFNEIQEQEREFLRNALDGFITAMQSERFPICGMDEHTLEYLIAVLAMGFEQYEISVRLVSNLLVSQTANNRTKDKARELKKELIERIKEKNSRTS